MFGYVVIDKDNVVNKIIREDFDQYKIVDNVERYEIGDRYPIVDLDDYEIAGVKFIDGMNNKVYYFRDYSFTEQNDIVVVDTSYGYQIAVVVEKHKRKVWSGIQPTKDIVGQLFDFEDFDERQKRRKQIATAKLEHDRQKLRETEEKKKATEEAKKEENDNVHIFHFEPKDVDEFYKIIKKLTEELIGD